MATHSGTLAWKTQWTKKPGRLQFMGLQRVGHDWATLLHLQLLYNVVLGPAVRWSESAICIHIAPPSWTSFQRPSPHPSLGGHHRALSWAELLVPHSRFPLAIYFTRGSVYMSIPTLSSPQPFLYPHPPSSHVHSLHLCFYPCPASRFICAIFLFVFLFLTYFTLDDRL